MKKALLELNKRRNQLMFRQLFAILALWLISEQTFGQAAGSGGQSPDGLLKVAEVVIAWDSIIPPTEVQTTLSPKILKAVNIFPNSQVTSFDLDLAQAKVLALPEIGRVKLNIDLLTGNDVRLVVMVRVADKIKAGFAKTGMAVSVKRKDFPTIYQDEKTYIKISLAGNLVPTLMSNTWWGNGKTFTEFNPFGKNPPGTEPSLDFEAYLTAGISGITRIKNGEMPIYAFGSVKALGITTLGQELYNANSHTNNFQIEEAYGGFVGAKTTSTGHLMRFMVSFGKQPYKIGTGMQICQIGGNGGTWGGMNAWPRFSGKLVGLAKLAIDKWRFEGFYIKPNDYTNNRSYTKLAGINAEYNQSYGLSGGFTYINVFESKFPYFFPDYTQTTRKGLNAMNLRFQWMPKPTESFLFAKAEGGLQLNGKIPMLAYGMAIEGGWSFGDLKLRPAVSYRYSLLTGDDPKTSRYEKWDILYSGDDITTWVQGPLMKNILFNSNMEVSRFQLQLFPKGWRVTSQYTFIMANQLNTVPSPPIGTFSDKQIGQEASLIVERFVSRNIYVRLMATSLWAGKGVADVLPNPVTKPWTELVAMLKFSF